MNDAHDKEPSDAFQPSCQWPKDPPAASTTFSIPYQDPTLEPRGLDNFAQPQPPTHPAFYAEPHQHPFATSHWNQPQPPTHQALDTTQHQNPHPVSNSNQPQPPRGKLEGFWSTNFIRGIENIDMSLEPTVPKRLNFITGNKNKLAEVQAILEGVIELQSQNIDLVEIQGTVEEVTTDKCRRAAEAIQGPVLVEDTCLCFKAMNDLPGPYIKWFMLAIGPLKLHHMLDGFEDKSAQAVCTFAYSQGPGHEPVLFQGRTDGKLVASRGSTVFGWDSCFEYEGKTYAEMDKSEKNKISHRGKALDKLKEWLARRADA